MICVGYDNDGLRKTYKNKLFIFVEHILFGKKAFLLGCRMLFLFI